MIENKLGRLEELTLEMDSKEEIYFFDEYQTESEPSLGSCNQEVCNSLSQFFRDIPNNISESLLSGSPIDAKYTTVLPEGSLTVALQGSTLWDETNRKCLLGIEVSMTSPGSNKE